MECWGVLALWKGWCLGALGSGFDERWSVGLGVGALGEREGRHGAGLVLLGLARAGGGLWGLRDLG